MAGKLPGRALANTANIALQTISVGNSTVNTVINSTSISVAGGGRFGGHLMPTANVTYDIGNSAMRWKDLWLSGTTINLGGMVHVGMVIFLAEEVVTKTQHTGLVLMMNGMHMELLICAGMTRVLTHYEYTT